MFIVAILIVTDVLGASESPSLIPSLECERPGCETSFTDRPGHMQWHHAQGLLFLSLSLSGNNSPRLGGWLTVAFFFLDKYELGTSPECEDLGSQDEGSSTLETMPSH